MLDVLPVPRLTVSSQHDDELPELFLAPRSWCSVLLHMCWKSFRDLSLPQNQLATGVVTVHYSS